MQKWRALLPLLLVGTAAQPIFTAFEHVAADPCAANLPTSAPSDCSTGLPLTSVTYFYDPSALVIPPAAATTLTVYGKNLVSATFSVSMPAGSCNSPISLFGGAAFTANAAGTSIVITLDQGTRDTLAGLLQGHETAPVKLCWNPINGNGAAHYAGVTFARARRCTSAAGNCAATFVAIPLATAAQNALLSLQTSCCLAPVVTGTFAVSSCINPSTQACCGGIPYNPNVEKCCSWIDPSITAPSRTVFRVSALSAACPCFSTADCSREGSTESSCCLPSKYSELALATTQVSGQCFNPSIHRCCNTGMRYEPGSQQCCAINGIQSVNVPCPCAVDQDCWGGQTAGGPTVGNQIVPSTPSPRLSQFVCCKQTAPPPLEAERCNIYTNYPSGTGSYRNQRCNGQCIDSTYQICCNGAICRREFEQCCNATCCNLYVGTCGTGLRSGGAGVAPANWREFGLAYEVCTTVEQLSTVKSFWVFILPSFLLLGTLIVFALGIVFVHKAATRQFLVIERLLIAFAVASILLACPLYFAPVYKYGIITVIVAVFEILVAAAPFKGFRILGVVVAGILLLYLFDPFHGNHYLNLASGRTQSGNPDPETAGVWYTTGKSWRNITNAASTANHCVQWYGGYFRYDPLLQDYDRFSNPHISTFGYCGRGWVTTLLVVEGALLFATSVMFLCALLAAILPFKVAYDPIELEVRGTGSVLEYTR